MQYHGERAVANVGRKANIFHMAPAIQRRGFSATLTKEQQIWRRGINMRNKSEASSAVSVAFYKKQYERDTPHSITRPTYSRSSLFDDGSLVLLENYTKKINK